MKMQTTLTPKHYLSAMKKRMGSRFAWGSERFTGFMLGHFFYVTHHAGYEWNRRITNQKNTAFGYVKKVENGSEIRFLHFQGMLCPQILIPYLLFFAGYAVVTWPVFSENPILLIASMLIIVFAPLLESCIESITDGSIEGRKSLLGLLIDPSDYFAYLNHQNELR